MFKRNAYKGLDKIQHNVRLMEKDGKKYILKDGSKKYPIEQQVLEKTDHPNIITLEETISGGLFKDPILVIEHFEGKDILAAYYEDELKDLDFNSYARMMVDSIDHVHQKGYLHNDIKPMNFMLNDTTLKLIDFNSATPIGSKDQDALGSTYGYRPIEVLTGGNCPKTDVHSLGCTFYTWHMGGSPFLDHVNGDIHQYCKREEEILKSGPKYSLPDKDLDNLVKWMVEIDPVNRPSLKQVRKALRYQE